MSSNIKKYHPIAPPENAKPTRKSAFGEKLTRNTAIATLLLLTVVGVRASAVPHGDSLLQSVQSIIENEWDENIGKLTYVGNMLTESVQVFGYNEHLYDLVNPVKTQAIQTWSASSPYLIYENAGDVFAVADGEVASIAHDDNDRYIVRIFHTNGLECLYYGLDTCAVREGENVHANTLLGMSSVHDFAFEARRNGKSVDVSASFEVRH